MDTPKKAASGKEDAWGRIVNALREAELPAHPQMVIGKMYVFTYTRGRHVVDTVGTITGFGFSSEGQFILHVANRTSPVTSPSEVIGIARINDDDAEFKWQLVSITHRKPTPVEHTMARIRAQNDQLDAPVLGTLELLT